ncbi:hypothetical protein [Entomomonas asaccharolytica]|uniref:Uncharacterized protein n=1 Tax=Entomomonas asaccharolytica TaxID=2785331 RepID=A0A974RYZ1_9GAMM|nr:hypothetical protein [Entomomonas asaccharolytica]QQP86479.1 hypothetical protein JHT90_04360 [Entomomonas asaccharolytica]
MLEISVVFVLDSVKIKLTPYQLFFYYQWLLNVLYNNYYQTSSESSFYNQLTIDKAHCSTSVLSTDQYKYLVLIVVLLETHPIVILVEWTANRYPTDYDKSYMETLSLLKKEGFTVHYYQ